ncbi:hypothetical protein DMUE_2295 [Dictyocoela muelleri]|nr:hypothetical protein DMUE_2295 [Dictyocoela muelleri]
MFLNDIKKRNSYTAKFKLEVIKDYETKNLNGEKKLKIEVADKCSITPKILQFWLQQIQDQEKILGDDNKSINKCMKIDNSGRKIPFGDVYSLLLDCVVEKSIKRPVFKENDFQSKALKIADSLVIYNFKCSRGYIEKFKKRNNLVSHRHTSCRTILPNTNS